MLAPSTTIPIARDFDAPIWKRRAFLFGPSVILFGAIGASVGWVAGIVVSATAFFILGAALRFFDRSQRLTFVVADGRLDVRGDPLFSEIFALSEFDLDRSEPVDLSRKGPLALRWKTCGTGMPGYYSGEFTLANGENAVVFISDKRRVLHLPRKHAPALLLSVPDPTAFRELLREARA